MFWYHRKEEEALLFKNYLVLVERSGYDPPQHVVEDNVIEIARRLDAIEGSYAIIIQSMYRGVTARMFTRMLFWERARLNGVRATAARRVQSWYRLQRCVGLLRQMRATHTKKVVLDKYTAQRAVELRAVRQKRTEGRVQELFRQLQREAYAAGVTGKIGYAGEDKGRLDAFVNSAFGTKELEPAARQIFAHHDDTKVLAEAKRLAEIAEQERRRAIEAAKPGLKGAILGKRASKYFPDLVKPPAPVDADTVRAQAKAKLLNDFRTVSSRRQHGGGQSFTGVGQRVVAHLKL